MKQVSSNFIFLTPFLGVLWFACVSCGATPEDSKSEGETPTAQPAENFIPSQSVNSGAQITPQTQKLPLQYPLILHHGFMGGRKMGSFGNVPSALGALGIQVLQTEVSPANTIAFRAQQLAGQIDDALQKSGKPKVNIVAHSMGGLDARYLISKLGYADKVASLTTLGTPHRGTPLADTIVQMNGGNDRQLLNAMAAVLGRSVNGSSQISTTDLVAAAGNLTEAYVNGEFNAAVADAPNVYYQSYAGVSGIGSGDRLPLIMTPGWLMIRSQRGPNDGLVPEQSAQWGNYRGSLKADHIDLVGITTLGAPSFDYVGFFRTLAAELAQRGY